MARHYSALIGKAGEALVAAELLRRHVDVAVPTYDGGVDLIAYREHNFQHIVPIQVKAGSRNRFNFQKSWFRIDGLVLIHVWNVRTTPEFYIFASLDQVVEALGPRYAASPSWMNKGGYSVTDPGPEIVERMQPHRDKWERIIGRIPA